ncbi:hypothetical protein V8G54_036723, partial [Vigna mungo]
ERHKSIRKLQQKQTTTKKNPQTNLNRKSAQLKAKQHDPNTQNKINKRRVFKTQEKQKEKQMSDLQDKNVNNGENTHGNGTTSSGTTTKKTMFFSSVSETLEKLNPFKNGSKDTTHLEDGTLICPSPEGEGSLCLRFLKSNLGFDKIEFGIKG